MPSLTLEIEFRPSFKNRDDEREFVSTLRTEAFHLASELAVEIDSKIRVIEVTTDGIRSNKEPKETRGKA